MKGSRESDMLRRKFHGAIEVREGRMRSPEGIQRVVRGKKRTNHTTDSGGN